MTYFWVIQRATIPDPWNNFKSTPKCVDVWVCVCKWKKHRPTVHFCPTKKNQSHRSYIRSEQILSEEETDLSELVALASCRPAEGCCSLFTRQTSAISNFLLAAHLSPHAVRPRHPSANRGWLLRLRKKMTNNWNCTLGSSNQNCRCWWVACVYCFHFWPILSRRRSAVFHRQHPCWPRMFEGRLLTRGTRLTDSAGTSCMCLVKKKKKMIWYGILD